MIVCDDNTTQSRTVCYSKLDLGDERSCHVMVRRSDAKRKTIAQHGVGQSLSAAIDLRLVAMGTAFRKPDAVRRDDMRESDRFHTGRGPIRNSITRCL